MAAAPGPTPFTSQGPGLFLSAELLSKCRCCQGPAAQHGGHRALWKQVSRLVCRTLLCRVMEGTWQPCKAVTAAACAAEDGTPLLSHFSRCIRTHRLQEGSPAHDEGQRPQQRRWLAVMVPDPCHICKIFSSA